MPLWLLTLVLKTGIPSRFAKAAAFVAIAIALAAAIALLWLAAHAWMDKQRSDAVELDRADMTAEVANRVIEADRSANANATAAAVVDQKNEKELDDAAHVSDGNATISVLQRLRQQQKDGRR